MEQVKKSQLVQAKCRQSQVRVAKEEMLRSSLFIGTNSTPPITVVTGAVHKRHRQLDRSNSWIQVIRISKEVQDELFKSSHFHPQTNQRHLKRHEVRRQRDQVQYTGGPCLVVRSLVQYSGDPVWFTNCTKMYEFPSLVVFFVKMSKKDYSASEAICICLICSTLLHIGPLHVL